MHTIARTNDGLSLSLWSFFFAVSFVSGYACVRFCAARFVWHESFRDAWICSKRGKIIVYIIMHKSNDITTNKRMRIKKIAKTIWLRLIVIFFLYASRTVECSLVVWCTKAIVTLVFIHIFFFLRLLCMVALRFGLGLICCEMHFWAFHSVSFQFFSCIQCHLSCTHASPVCRRSERGRWCIPL